MAVKMAPFCENCDGPVLRAVSPSGRVVALEIQGTVVERDDPWPMAIYAIRFVGPSTRCTPAIEAFHRNFDGDSGPFYRLHRCAL
jgi:hypothetical protein